MFVCTGCLLNTEKLQDVNTWMNFHQNPACVHILKTDITHPYFRASPVGDAKFCSSSCSDPHLCQEGGESHKLPFFFGASCKRPSDFPSDCALHSWASASQELQASISAPWLTLSLSLSLPATVWAPKASVLHKLSPANPAASRSGEAWNNRRPWGCLQGSS